MNANPTTLILTATLSFLTAVGGVIAFLFRGIIAYLFDRIKTLENREQTVLTSLVETAENLQESQKTTAAFVVTLVEDRNYAERRRREDRGQP